MISGQPPSWRQRPKLSVQRMLSICWYVTLNAPESTELTEFMEVILHCLTAQLSRFLLTGLLDQQSKPLKIGVRTQQKMNKTFSWGSSPAQEMKQSLVGLLADSVCVSLKGQLIIQNSFKVLTLPECLNWKPLYDGWWRGGRPSTEIKLHILHSRLSMSAQSELMLRKRRKKCGEERVKAVNFKCFGKNKRCANSVLKLLRWKFEVEQNGLSRFWMDKKKTPYSMQ